MPLTVWYYAARIKRQWKYLKHCNTIVCLCAGVCERNTNFLSQTIQSFFSSPQTTPLCSPRARPGGRRAACRKYWRNIWYKNMSPHCTLSWDISLLPKNCSALIQSPLSFFSPPSIWTGFNYNENMCCVIKTPMRVLSQADSRFSPLHTFSSYWLCYNTIKVADTVVGNCTPGRPPVSLICARPWESWLKDHYIISACRKSMWVDDVQCGVFLVVHGFRNKFYSYSRNR